MKVLSVLVTTALLISHSGCTSLAKPSLDTLNAIPVVEFGDPVPADGEFILYFPAGKPIPVVASIKGSALAQSAEATLNVTLNKDIYSYKEWASFDHKIWQRGEDVLAVSAEIKIPGYEHPKPGLIKLQVDLK